METFIGTKGQGRVDSLIFLWGTKKGSVTKITSLVQTRKFKIVWLKLPFLGEVEIAVRLGVLLMWGLAKMIPLWACFWFLFFFLTCTV